MTVNHSAAHYDLGAGGDGVTTDCYDSTPMAAFDATTGGVTNGGPHCFAGGRLQGVSTGVNYKFRYGIATSLVNSGCRLSASASIEQYRPASNALHHNFVALFAKSWRYGGRSA